MTTRETIEMAMVMVEVGMIFEIEDQETTDIKQSTSQIIIIKCTIEVAIIFYVSILVLSIVCACPP